MIFISSVVVSFIFLCQVALASSQVGSKQFTTKFEFNKGILLSLIKCKNKKLLKRKLCQDEFLHPKINPSRKQSFLTGMNTPFVVEDVFKCSSKERTRAEKYFRNPEFILCFSVKTKAGHKSPVGIVQYKPHKNRFYINDLN